MTPTIIRLWKCAKSRRKLRHDHTIIHRIKLKAAAELIKSGGLGFLQPVGEYKDLASHKDAFKLLAANVERLVQSEIKNYLVAVTPEKP